ncbi:hypothetical protein S7335_466 [Synechococcus sp. PCC 7335]|nr:hypothetical protein S7335_466 [Synechococcus sp. PCC 7335]
MFRLNFASVLLCLYLALFMPSLVSLSFYIALDDWPLN